MDQLTDSSQVDSCAGSTPVLDSAPIQVAAQKLTSGNETFTRGTYNGFAVTIRDSDGYVNAPKMVADINALTNQKKDFRAILRNDQF